MKTNKTFATLSFFGILMVVSAHCNGILNLFGNYFPYNSFFMPMFMFISGYFFKDKNVETFKSSLNYTKKKIINLMVYYYIWNIIYGLFMLILNKCNMYNLPINFNFKNIFILPFFHGQSFNINNPAWFIPTLFMIEIIFLFIRKIQLLIKKDTQSIFLLFFFIMAIVSVYFSEKNTNIIYSPFKKIGFFLFFFQLGKFYKEKLEFIENKINTIYVFTVTILINIVCIKLFNDINFPSLYNMEGFRDLHPIIPIITSITGIWFWLRISRILATVISENNIFKLISNNTKAIMMHHIFFMAIFNFILYFGRNLFKLNTFNTNAFKSSCGWYRYFGNSSLFYGSIYIFAGIFGPLLFVLLEKLVIKIFKKTTEIIKQKYSKKETLQNGNSINQTQH